MSPAATTDVEPEIRWAVSRVCAAIQRIRRGLDARQWSRDVSASADGLEAMTVCVRVRVAITAEPLVAVHPSAGEHRGGQGNLAGECRAGADFGELFRLALAITAEELQALTLSGPPPAAAIGAEDEAGQGDRPVVIAVREQPRVGDSCV